MQMTLGQIYADKYRIVRLLGEGAMGAVYEAENTRIHRRVALKLLHPQLAHKADTLRRFEREAQAAGRIGSQHIVEVLDLGELADGSRFMVLEYLDGTTLDQRIRARRRLTPEEATPIVCQLLEGLGAAHKAEIIHRDLKPANVYLCPRSGAQAGGVDFVKILDFGVSKFNVLDDEMSMTSTGAVLGTPYYMSPEQAKGSRQIDPRSDLYAVGVILYECITGQVPFSAETFNELIFRIVLESPPPVESFVPNLDPAFTAIIHKAMAREPSERFQTAEEFHAILHFWSERAAAGPVLPTAPGSQGVGGTMLMDQASSLLPDDDNARTMAMAPRAPVSATSRLPAPQPRAELPTQALPQMPSGFEVAPPQGSPGAAALAPASENIPGFSEEMAAIPKSRNGVGAFVGGLLAVLAIGGGSVALVKWKADTKLAPVGTAVAVAPRALVPAPPPPEPVLAAPTPSAPVAAATIAYPSTPARSSTPARPATTSATPTSHGKTTAPNPTGKRTVSNEL